MYGGKRKTNRIYQMNFVSLAEFETKKKQFFETKQKFSIHEVDSIRSNEKERKTHHIFFVE